MSLPQLIGLGSIFTVIILGLVLLFYFKKHVDKLFYQAIVKAMTVALVLLFMQIFFSLIDLK